MRVVASKSRLVVAVKARIELASLTMTGAASIFSSANAVEKPKAKQNKTPSSANGRKRRWIENSDDISVSSS